MEALVRMQARIAALEALAAYFLASDPQRAEAALAWVQLQFDGPAEVMLDSKASDAEIQVMREATVHLRGLFNRAVWARTMRRSPS